MQLTDLIEPRDFLIGFEPADKWEAVRALLEHLVAVGRVDAARKDDLLERILDRERSMSTGMEHGVAIPHAAVEGLPRAVAGIGAVATPGGLAFESIDARPTYLVVLLLIPKAQKLLHIRTLAEIARVLSREGVRQALVSARTPDEAWHALAEGQAAVGG